MSRSQKIKGKGTQLDTMKRVRKEMPPGTRVHKPKNKPKPAKNWRDYLEDDDLDLDNDL